VGDKSTPEQINEMVTHETEHRVQDNDDRLGRPHRLRLRVRQGVKQAGGLLLAASTANSLSILHNPDSAFFKPNENLGLAALGAVQTIGALLDYRYSKIEREAFATKKDLLPVVSFSPQELPAEQPAPELALLG